MRKISLNNIILIILGIVIIAGILYFYVFNNIDNVFENKTIDFTKINSTTYKDNLKINNKEVSIEYTQDFTKPEGPKVLKINGKEVAKKDFYCGGPAILKTLKDNIVVSYHLGCSYFNYSLGIYDSEGNTIKTIEYLNDQGMRLTETNKSYTIDNNTITYRGSRIGEATGGLYISSDQIHWIDICKANEREAKDVKDNDLVSATYKIEYLGNNKYSTPKITESKTIKEYVTQYCTNQ